MTDSHTEQLIATKLRRLEKLELQQAQHSILTPPHISIELEELRQEITALRYQRTQLIFQANHLDLQPPPSAQGLLLLVSPRASTEPLQSLASYQAIDYHRTTLRHCWLIATDGVSSSRSTAEELLRHFTVYGVQGSIHIVNNGADAIETLILVQSIYAQIEQENQLNSELVIADITGGTKAMTAGMVLGCGTARPLQYMRYKERGLPSLPVLLNTHPLREAV